MVKYVSGYAIMKGNLLPVTHSGQDIQICMYPQVVQQFQLQVDLLHPYWGISFVVFPLRIDVDQPQI